MKGRHPNPRNTPAIGITLTRTSNCWNDFEELRDEVRELSQIGMQTIVNLIYSVSPRHTDEYYAQKAAKQRASSRIASASKTSADCSRRSAHAR